MQYGKNHHMQGKIKPDDANTEKQSLEIGGKTQLVPRLHTKYNKQDKQSNLMP
jgi:hypothetical protein